MRNSPKRAAWLLLLVLAGAIVADAQQEAGRRSRLRVIYYNGDMAHLLASLAESDGVVIGLETDPKKPWSQISIDLRYVILRDILNGIVQSEPLYQWRESNGSIEVVPVNKTASLIDTAIQKFEINNLSSAEAINRLVDLPEVQANIRSMRLTRRPSAALPSRTIEKKISLDLSGVSMREALTRIAAESDAKFWIYRTFPDGSFSLGTSTR